MFIFSDCIYDFLIEKSFSIKKQLSYLLWLTCTQSMHMRSRTVHAVEYDYQRNACPSYIH